MHKNEALLNSAVTKTTALRDKKEAHLGFKTCARTNVKTLPCL